ncbi:MAG TPA: TIGR03085 family metal-binding protein [Frankiaceae bacterium]|nr:TIGR03085 family metal-binding protein [Frankiaceae bacterium]
MTGIAARERASLVDLLQELGPDAPTLCEGWETQQLAAHLVAREGRPDALPGILIPALHDRTKRIEAQTLERSSYPDLVRSIAGGPPFGPLGLPGLADAVNVHEFFVHHEDVRRAQPGWTARALPADTVEALRRRLFALAPLLFRGLRGVRLHLETPDGRRRTVGRGDESVVISGELPELFLYAFGRRTTAEVSISGSVTGQAKLAAANLRQ